MNITSLLVLLLWLACSYLVVRFVLRTGGTTKVGHVAHWFGGAFTILGLAIGMVWIFAQLDHSFGARVHAYVMSHDIRLGNKATMIEQNSSNTTVTIYRPGRVNTEAMLDGSQVRLDESKTIRTSIWWLLWASGNSGT